MMSFWNNLQPRERLMVAGGGAALLLLLLYALVIDPYVSAMTQLRQEVAAQRETLVWMRSAAAEAKALRGNAPQPTASGQSLLALTDSTAKGSGLAGALRRVQPEGQRGVQVWLEQASFDALMQWLHTLTREHGARIMGLTVEPAANPGSVNARVALEGAA